MMFTTSDRDNDELTTTNCAAQLSAPWWHRKCAHALLTGAYGRYPAIGTKKGVMWYSAWGSDKFAKYATMMVRPV